MSSAEVSFFATGSAAGGFAAAVPVPLMRRSISLKPYHAATMRRMVKRIFVGVMPNIA